MIVFGELTLGGSMTMRLTATDADDDPVVAPVIEAWHQAPDAVEAIPLVVTAGVVTFVPTVPGTHKLSLRVTSPVLAVVEGVIRVSPSIVEINTP